MAYRLLGLARAIFTAAPRHRELQVIKIIGSAFADFARDEHALTTAE